jgi:hypothetical protein
MLTALPRINSATFTSSVLGAGECTCVEGARGKMTSA